MNRLFGQSKNTAVPKPTLNDTAATLDARVETVNKQISGIDLGSSVDQFHCHTSYCSII